MASWIPEDTFVLSDAWSTCENYGLSHSGKKSIPMDTLVLSDPWYARENSKEVLFTTISKLSPDSGKDYSNFHSLNQTQASDKRSLF